MNSSLPLRIALIANAVFSFTCAMLMVFNSPIIDEILGIQAPLVIQFVFSQFSVSSNSGYLSSYPIVTDTIGFIIAEQFNLKMGCR